MEGITNTTDSDLEELESRLYSQVFHSTENWDTSLEQNTNNFEIRHVSEHSINNVTTKGNRYWCEKAQPNSEVIPQILQNSEENVSKVSSNSLSSKNEKNNRDSNQNIEPLIASSTNISDQVRDSNPSVRAETSTVSQETSTHSPLTSPIPSSTGEVEYRKKILKYNSVEIPTTFKLPKSTCQQFPEHILKYFQIGSKRSRKKFRNFLLNLEIQNNNSEGETARNNYHEFLQRVEQEKPRNNRKRKPKVITADDKYQDFLQKLRKNNPIYMNHFKSDKFKEKIPLNTTVSDKQSVKKKVDIPAPNSTTVKVNNDVITLSDSDDSVIEVPLPPIPVYNVESSDEELENPITETPKNNENNQEKQTENISDVIQTTEEPSKNNSNVSITTENEREELLQTTDSNDFLVLDNTLNENNVSFNFGLHSSELDLSKDRETVQKPPNEQDLYETESSCSDVSAFRSRPVFNEINFESPTKDIFCEPNLTEFSNFITPNRAKSSFTRVKTKATPEKETRQHSRSESSEYNSDPTVLKTKNKRKRYRKRKKGLEDKEPENIPEEPNSTSDNPNPESTKSDQPEKQDLTDYYKDTYFADDCLVFEDIQSFTDEPNKDEVSNSEKIDQTLPSTSNTSSFSFVDTWRKSSDQNSATESKTDKNETSPSKKQKTDDSTSHPYVVTIISDSDSNSSEISVGQYVRPVEKKDSQDLQLVNVQNKTKPKLVANPFSFVNTYLNNKEKKSFKDYWTTDMKKFYENSWGQENFDVMEAQSSMSKNPADWKIIPTDIFSISERKRGPICFRCRERGHREYNCTHFKGPIKCTTCGLPGHMDFRCPNSMCTTCRTPTRSFATSCAKCVHFRHMRCTTCKNIGHEMRNCPDLWRRYHLTTKSSDELVKKTSSSPILKAPNKRWCSNCARRGHLEDQCPYLREHFATTPEIMSYEPVYNDSCTDNLRSSSNQQVNIPHFKETNVTIADLQGMRQNAAHDTSRKYMNILRKLRQKCNKHDFDLINQIDRLRQKEFNKKNIHEIYKIRARIEKNKVS